MTDETIELRQKVARLEQQLAQRDAELNALAKKWAEDTRILMEHRDKVVHRLRQLEGKIP